MNKNMLRIVAAAVAITTVIGLCACKSNKPDASGTNATAASTTINTQASADTPTEGLTPDPTTTDSVAATEPTGPATKPTTGPATEPTAAPTTAPTDPSTKPSHTHSWKAATCTTPKTCTTCGATEGAAAHKWKAATCEEPKKCTACGLTEGAVGTHNYVNNVCAACYRVNAKDTDTFLEIGSPMSYTTGNPAHCACALTEWSGLIYRGGGDYDKNSGKTDIWAYDPAGLKWIKTGTANDECISKFINLNGVLTAPGIDPCEDQTYGNYYQLISGKWQKIRKIPGGIHNFDMISFEGKTFVALGVAVGKQPVKYTTDGEAYTDVPLYKNGSKVKVSSYQWVRAYEFFVKDDQLYALMGIRSSNYEDFYVYRYTGDKMEYVGEAYTFIYGAGSSSFNYVSADFTFNGEFYVAANGFFKITDFATASGIQKIQLPQYESVKDVVIEGDTAYLLSNVYNYKDSNKPVRVAIYKTKDMKNFEELTSFQYEITALSMVKYDGFLYLSVGHAAKTNIKNGTIIRIKL